MYPYIKENFPKLIPSKYYMSADGNMQQSGFGEVSVVSADVIKKLRHRKHMLLSTDYWRKHFEKWSGYPVSAATET